MLAMKEKINNDETSKSSYLVVVVLKVRILTLQLNHLQPGDPLSLFGRHEITIRIPAIKLSTNTSCLS